MTSIKPKPSMMVDSNAAPRPGAAIKPEAQKVLERADAMIAEAGGWKSDSYERKPVQGMVDALFATVEQDGKVSPEESAALAFVADFQGPYRGYADVAFNQKPLESYGDLVDDRVRAWFRANWSQGKVPGDAVRVLVSSLTQDRALSDPERQSLLALAQSGVLSPEAAAYVTAFAGGDTSSLSYGKADWNTLTRMKEAVAQAQVDRGALASVPSGPVDSQRFLTHLDGAAAELDALLEGLASGQIGEEDSSVCYSDNPDYYCGLSEVGLRDLEAALGAHDTAPAQRVFDLVSGALELASKTIGRDAASGKIYFQTATKEQASAALHQAVALLEQAKVLTQSSQD